MSDYAAMVAEDIRLTILQVLAEDTDYAVNEHILAYALARVGHNVSRDRIRTDLRWLAEQDLLTNDTGAGLYVAKATQRGVDVAEGRAQVPGVARRRPGP